MELFYPTRYPKINQKFGNKNPIYTQLGMVGHNGIDFAIKDREEIYCSHDGIVTYAGVDNSEGFGVVVRSLTEPYFKTIYWHLAPEGIKVKVGQRVNIGDVLALGDNTGLSTGTHLHFGFKWIAKGENEWIWYNTEQSNGYFGASDPMSYFSAITAYQVRDTIQKAQQIILKVLNFIKTKI